MRETMPLDLDALRVFTRVAELASFTRAGEQLGMPKARVSLRVKKLERELGTPLLQRSTRSVRLTAEGEQLLARATRLLVDADDVAAMFQSSRALKGEVRMDLPVTFARELVLPRLPELLARHPELRLVISTTDRRVDARKEGFDCVLRVGPVGDPSLVGRRLGLLEMVNLVSAAYLRRYGLPRTLDDLDRHFVVHYSSRLSGEPPSFEYREEERYREKPMRSFVTVNNVDAYTAACVAGLGIIQVPRVGSNKGPRAELVEILPELTCAPLPVTLLHTHGSSVPRRVRGVMTWIAEVMAPHLTLASRAGS